MWPVYIIGVILYVVILELGSRSNRRKQEHTRQLLLSHEKVWRYLEALHAHGVGSDRAEDVKYSFVREGNGLDEAFERRAEVLDQLFRL